MMKQCNSGKAEPSSTQASIRDAMRILRVLLGAMVTSIHVDIAHGADGEARRTEAWTAELEKAIGILEQSIGME